MAGLRQVDPAFVLRQLPMALAAQEQEALRREVAAVQAAAEAAATVITRAGSDALFAQLDANGDGELSQKEVCRTHIRTFGWREYS